MMIKYTFTLFLTFLFPFSLVTGQIDWTKVSSKDSIIIYTSEVKGSNIKTFKAVTHIHNTSLNEIAGIILDVNNFPEFIPDCINSRILVKHNDGHIIHYVHTKVQWPFEDRDGVYELKVKNNNSKYISINIKCIDFEYPLKKGVVRMNRGNGHWIINMVDQTNAELTYQYHADPGGKLPAWLVNTSIISVPHRTLLNLKNIVKSGKYKNKMKLDFIQ